MANADAPDPHDQPTIDAPQAADADDTTPGARLELSGDRSFAGKDIGDYEIIEEIGRGGMGVVYKARQKKPQRIVALKMILGGRLASDDDLKRFLIEAEASAQLQHRHIVTVYQVGEIDGQHYYTMEFVEGISLMQKLGEGPLSGKDAARYIETTAHALQFAHTQGFLHRDLKPSNIMVDQDDQPRIMDFGLAKRLGEAKGQTQTGALLGTPSYMSPEQASGNNKTITEQSDVYGLGAVLYELLTGKPPFYSDTHIDTVMHVLQSEPVPPRLLNPKIDPDLETICLKCLEKDPRNRYASCDELADDLQRYRNGESIKARSFNVIDRLTRVLARGHHDADFHAWSAMLFWLAAIILVEHVAVFGLAKWGVADIWLMLTRVSQFVVLGVIFWSIRKSHILPRTAAERELWTIWAGYLLSYAAGFAVMRVLTVNVVTARDPSAITQWDSLIMYPISSLLSGLAFFIMGCNYWGRCYAYGVAFFAMAIVSTWHIDWAPLEFGLLWAVALVSLGFRLQRLGEAEQARQQFAEETTQAAVGMSDRQVS